MIGQSKLISKIDTFTLDSLPRSIIISGDKGSGRHSLINYISNRFNLNLYDISNELSYEKINDINNSVSPAIYMIDCSLIAIKDQNTILKFLEEPLKNAYIFLITDNKYALLNTVLNRCQLWELEQYTVDQLRTFISVDNPLLLSIAKTPGQVIDMQSVDMQVIYDLCNKIFTKINVANLPNTLTIADKIAFKNEGEKINLNIFLCVLYCVAKQLVISADYEQRYVQAYELTRNYMFDSKLPKLDQRYLFEHYLVNLRSVMRGSLT